MTRFFGLSHISAGFIAVLVGYTSSAAIVFQAATAAGANAAYISSWLLALGLGMGVTCIGLSLYYRSPVLTAWSTPGAALLATALAGVPMSEAIGAFIFASALLAICGLAGWIDLLMKHIPKSLAAAMLGGGIVALRSGSVRVPGIPTLAGGPDAADLLCRQKDEFSLHDSVDLSGRVGLGRPERAGSL